MDFPFLTHDLPGTGGRLRALDDDFVVEEVPAYAPAGVGDHTYLRIEKRGIPTMEAVTRVARALGVRPRDIGYAGLKDAHAVAEQTFSIEHFPPERARAALVGIPGVRVLDARLHKNKLKLGHLRGNRFRIRLRDVGPDADAAAARASAVLNVLGARGVPHWFGEQRFGSRADNDAVGRLIVRGDFDAACDTMLGPGAVADADARVADARARYAAGDLEGASAAFPPPFRTERGMLDALLHGRSKRDALLAAPRPLLRLLVSAYQSALFNRLLEERMRADTLGTLETGDLAFLHDRGAVFRVEDAAAEQPRADALLISPSGPLFGTKTLLASGAPGDRERALLDGEGVRPEQFDVPGLGALEGERRPFRIPVLGAEVTPEPLGTPDLAVGAGDVDVNAPSVVVAFELPRGAYATAVMHEIRK